MSRMQNILEKAERDGSLPRVAIIGDPTAAATLAFDTKASAPPAVEDYVAVVTVPVSPMPASSVPVSIPLSPVTVPSVTAPPLRTVTSAGLDRNLVAALRPGAPTAEQYRALRTRLAHTDRGVPVAALLVTSPGRGEGKSLTSANLALTMAQDVQTRICIVDADLRHSRLHTLFGISETPGLADVLTGRTTLDEALVRLEDQQIVMLPAGQIAAHPAELLGTTAMRRTIETLRTQFDRVIIDAPAISPLADVGILSPLVDGLLLVVHAGVTTKPAIQEAVAAIGTDKLLGVLLNGGAA
jgi:capsular exopolysaccharide synthesis family protein